MARLCADTFGAVWARASMAVYGADARALIVRAIEALR